MAESFGGFSSFPGSPAQGDNHNLTGSFYDEAVFSDSWRLCYAGREAIAPVLGNLTWFNQGSASAAMSGGALTMTVPAGTPDTNLHGLSQPIAGDFRGVEFLYLGQFGGYHASGGGVLFRESSSGKLLVMGYDNESGSVTVIRFSSPTSPSSQVHTSSVRPWLTTKPIARLRFQSGTMYFEMAPDAANYKVLYSEAGNAFFDSGPDEVGFETDAPSSGPYITMTVLHWKVIGAVLIRPRHISDSLSSLVRMSPRAIY